MADKPIPPARDAGAPPPPVDWQRKPVTPATDTVIEDLLRESRFGRTR